MTICISNGQWWQTGIAFAATFAALLFGNSASAQIAPDRTLGAESSVVTPNTVIKGLPSDRIDGGAIRGANLFHSFLEFNVGEGRGVYFSNPGGIENIFSRVTGSNASNIFGKLGVLGNANLFLLNPNGIIFGPNASLDLGGSFVGSTGNSFNFGGGKEFSATNPTAPPLLTVNVPLGVQFNQEQPRAIVNSGNLSAGTGQNLTLLGGAVVSTGQLSALGGQVGVAAVPSGSVVRLSSSGQLLNIDVPSPEARVGSSENSSSASLTQLLANKDGIAYPGLTVNSNGQVELLRSGLPVVDGDVVADKVTAQSATLTANHNLTLVESQLGTTGNLNLLAGDTVRVRDSVANPFVAQAGGNLTIQGNQSIDILALNHPQTHLVSRGNLSLISDGNISGDAHFSSGSQFSIFNLAGQPGNFFSLYDPIISANGDVQFGDYTGAALKVESTGRIIGGNITITSPDSGLSTNPNDPDVDILRTSKSVILRAGLPSLIYANNIPTLAEGTNFNPAGASPLAPGSIQVGNIVTSSNVDNVGPVILEASGNVTTTGVSSFVSAGGSGNGGNITLISRNGSINTKGKIVSSTPNGTSGNIRLQANGDITIENEIASRILEDGAGSGTAGKIEITSVQGNINLVGEDTPSAIEDIIKRNLIRDIRSSTPNGTGGDIVINANQGQITVTPKGRGQIVKTVQNQDDKTGWKLRAESNNGVAGNVTLKADGNIYSPNIQASSRNNSNESFSTITLNSSKGSVFLDKVQLRTDNIGSKVAGDIIINAAQNVEITGSAKEDILTNGYFGRILIDAVGNVSITNSELTAQASKSLPEPSTTAQAGNIQVTSQNGNIDINNSIINSSTSVINVGSIDAGNININATNGSVSVTNASQVLSSNAGGGEGDAGSVTIKAKDTVTIAGRSTNNLATVGTDVTGGGVGNGGLLSIEAPSVDIKDRAIVAASILSGRGRNGELAQAGDVNIKATDRVSVNNSVVSSEIGPNSVGNGGTVNITSPTISLDNGASLITDVRFDEQKGQRGEGKGGDINITTQSLSLKGGSLLATSTSGQSSADGQGGAGNVFITPINTEASNTVSVDGQGTNDFSSLFPSLGDGKVSSAILSTVEEAAQGVNNGGTIDITTGSFSVTNGALIDASTFAQGSAGKVIINARDTVLFDNAKAFTSVEEGGTGRGGDIRISIPTGSLIVRNGAQLYADTVGEGNAGNIIINASDSVNISGSSPITGSPSALFTSTSRDSTGAGGDIIVGDINKPNLFRISDGAVLFASTANNDKAGNITVNANRFEAINGGQLIARTTSSGAAGTITVKADRRVSVSGRDATFADRRSKLSNTQLPIENILTNPDTNRIVTNSAPNSEVFSGFYVNSQNSISRAGDIEVNSPIVFLDNKGRLIADSGSSDGGNITLQNGHLLLLGRNSLISTSAGTGNGGNIEIKYPKGFIIAAFGRNNDIVANALTGAGGKVTINALGAVNIEALKKEDLMRRLQPKPDPLDPQRLLTNEITAISQAGGPDLQGTVNLNAPNVDPTRGTIQLPENLDSSRLIAPSCPVGIPGAASRFVVTGRGGLPPNPGSALSTDTFLGNAANASSGENRIASTSVLPREAQGVKIGSRGQIILTARPSTLTPHTHWQRSIGCYGK